MPLPALAAVAGLAAAAHLGRRGSAAKLSEENKKRIVNLVKRGLVSDARNLATKLGFDTLDLSGADLQRAYLTDTDLTRADLTGADLTGADLTGAYIQEAIGINIGPARTFVGIPHGYIEARSPFVPGRTALRRTE